MIDAFSARLKARKLLRLLDDERVLLLSGQLTALPALSAERDQLFHALGQTSRANTKALAEYGSAIRNRAERNHRLLGAALDGMRSSASLLNQNSDPSALQTYTASGKRVPVSNGQTEALRRT
ncbi:MAG: hypothetical protein WD046_02515 [Paracoccaceae bacterium]